MTLMEIIDDLAKDCHETAAEHGFWDERTPLDRGPECIALMHSELSEALEWMRQPGPWIKNAAQRIEVTTELADVMIRVLDYCGAAGLPIGQVLVDKMEKNRGRPHKHAKAF